MRVSLHSADLHYGGGLVLHTASSGSIPHLKEVYLRLDDDETIGIGEVRANIAYLNGFAEGTVVDQNSVWSDLRLLQRSELGVQPGYTTLDLSAGIDEKTYSLEIFAKNITNETVQLYRYAECTPQTCAPYTVYAGLGQPRLIGIKYGQKF